MALGLADSGERMHDLIRRLYPICRSLTGEGVRETLAILAEHVPVEVREVPTGTRVLDWEVPKEWNVRGAYIADASGRRVVDFADSNLHLMGYSVPVRQRMSLEELTPHLFSLPDRPDWTPYRTSYFKEQWGFCLPHRQLESLGEGEYEVCIDSTLEDGHLTYGELLLEGESEREVLFSCHVCHPSLCNDNLSGIVVATSLAAQLAERSRRYSYRFLFVPGMIGPITWLALNESRLERVAHGVVLTLLGDSGSFTYKRSRHHDAEIDRAVEHVLGQLEGSDVRNFSPWGYDERQYCSPGFDLPVGCLMRSPHGEFPEYHTSADDLEFVRPEALAESLATLGEVVDVLEGNDTFLNLSPKGEPQLGRRGLYGSVGGAADGRTRELALLWVLNLSDGRHSLLDIAERSGLPFGVVRDAASSLLDVDLLGPAGRSRTSGTA
jgi:aminopeptidase-like protein